MTGTAGNGSRADVRVGGSLLPRNRLIEALNGAKSVRVVVLEAPAGYSKTTTLRLWDDADTRPFAWVRCEPRYNDPALLANTLVGALGETDIDPELHESLASPVPDLNLLLERVSEAILGLDPFVLVIDDALSAIDVATEQQVLTAILAAIRGKTVLIVSHRINVLRRCDRIVLLDAGRIVARGTHRDLLVDPFYRAMADKQESHA